jgi:LacI family transcriptional regulator
MPRRIERPPTIIDVAREAGVGIMSVSRVMNHHPGVKESTREKVTKAMTRIGYTPNDAARMLKGRRGRTIGLIVPDLSDFYASCFHAIQAVAMQHEYQTLVAATGRNVQVEDRQIESMRLHGIAGLLIVSSGSNGNVLKTLQQGGIPIVAFDRPAALRTDAVLVENREGAAAGVRHLIEHGHQRIACVGFDSGSYTVRERIAGYEQAMQAAGLQPILIDDIHSEEAMEALAARWRLDANRPTAVFSLKRITSALLLRALHRQKLGVPAEIAVVGFDDFELAEVLGTPLTVVRQATTEMARAAVELLFDKIAAAHSAGTHGTAEQQQVTRLFFPVQLVARHSCGCQGEDLAALPAGNPASPIKQR